MHLEGPEFEAAWEEKLKQLCEEADEILKTIEKWEHKEKKQIEERLKKIKER